MPARVLAFLIAIVLTWTGLATHESLRPAAAALAAEQSSSVAMALPGEGDGSVADHHLDDRPTQVQIELEADLPALLLPAPLLLSPALRMARPLPHASSAWLSLYPDRPLRPPCARPLLLA